MQHRRQQVHEQAEAAIVEAQAQQQLNAAQYDQAGRSLVHIKVQTLPVVLIVERQACMYASFAYVHMTLDVHQARAIMSEEDATASLCVAELEHGRQFSVITSLGMNQTCIPWSGNQAAPGHASSD